MGVLPLQYKDGRDADALGQTGEETFKIGGLTGTNATARSVTERVTDPQAETQGFEADVRIDTPARAEYYRHGGILACVLRQQLDDRPASSTHA